MTINKQDRQNLHRNDGQLDDELQKELDDALGDMSIEQLIEADSTSQPVAKRADGVKIGTVIDIQGDDIFVDFGGKTQGLLPAAQFADDPLPEIGSKVEVTIEGYDGSEGVLLLSRPGAVLAATWATLRPGQIVEAFVTGQNKGGLEVKFNGIDGFIPVSMIDMNRTEDMGPFVGTKLKCEVLEVDTDRESVTLSRRAVMERESAEKRKETMLTLAEGKIVRGVVRSIMPYGAFVDIGGVDGLLHISDMSFRRIEDPHEVVKEGQQIEVKILKVDREAEKFSLGLKQVMPDPWTGADTKWPPNEVVTGRVTRLADFGAFVELEEGVEGLVPMSEMSFTHRVKSASEVVTVGDTIKVRVLSVDMARKRVSLSLKRVGDDPWMGASARWPVGTTVDGVVTRLADFGAFVELTSGVEGLVHISELSDQRVRAVNEAVREGEAVKAKVLDVDEERHRISLSIRAIKIDPNYTGAASAKVAAGAASAAAPAAGAASAPAAAAQPPVVEPPKPEKKRKTALKGGLDGPDWMGLLK